MPVETRCGSCAKRLRIADKYTGRTIRCPGCGAALKVPPLRDGVQAAPPAEMWYLLSDDQTEYGPVSKAELDGWVRDDRVTPACHLRLGGGDWRPAGEVYPSLMRQAAVEHAPVLKDTGKSKSMANLAVSSDLKKTRRGNAIKFSRIYQVGETRSFWERIRAGTHVGPFVQQKEVRVDQIHLLTISDPSGDFQMVIPYDNGMFCPVEFLGVFPGRLPASLGLLRGRGGNWGIEAANSAAGVFLPQAVRGALGALGGQADAVWVVLDQDAPQTAASIANGVAELRTNLRFDARLSMGPMELTFHVDWIAQAMPLDEQRSLLVAQFIPERKLFGVGLGASWFVAWRQQFLQMARQLPAGDGGFHCVDYGNWGVVAQEVLGIPVL